MEYLIVDENSNFYHIGGIDKIIGEIREMAQTMPLKQRVDLLDIARYLGENLDTYEKALGHLSLHDNEQKKRFFYMMKEFIEIHGLEATKDFVYAKISGFEESEQIEKKDGETSLVISGLDELFGE